MPVLCVEMEEGGVGLDNDGTANDCFGGGTPKDFGRCSSGGGGGGGSSSGGWGEVTACVGAGAIDCFGGGGGGAVDFFGGGGGGAVVFFAGGGGGGAADSLGFGGESGAISGSSLGSLPSGDPGGEEGPVGLAGSSSDLAATYTNAPCLTNCSVHVFSLE